MTTPTELVAGRFVRYMALCDDTPLGVSARAVMKWLVATASAVRLVPTGGLHIFQDEKTGVVVDQRGWAAYQSQLLAPVPADYVNAVCSIPEHWVRMWVHGHPNLLFTVAPPPAGDFGIDNYEHIVVCGRSDASTALVASWHERIARGAQGKLFLPQISFLAA